jgi:hypothetical protein
LKELDVGKEKMAILLGTNGYYATRRSQSSAKDDNNMLEITEKPTDRKEVTTPELSCLPEDPKDNKVYSQSLENWDPSTQKASQQQLYIQCLLDSVSKTGCDLATFSESKFVDGRKRGRRLILPWNITKSWLPSRSTIPTNLDPEHLPPAISSQRLGNITRIILARLPSDSSKFGLRVVAATMSIGIMAFLRNTQHFFVEYRIVWAMVMIPISMSPTAGTAIYGYIGRALGVAAAMALTYVNWYIVDGKPAGVIVVFFVCMMGYYFLLLKFPRFVVLFVLAAVNHVLIIGEHNPLFSPHRAGVV